MLRASAGAHEFYNETRSVFTRRQADSVHPSDAITGLCKGVSQIVWRLLSAPAPDRPTRQKPGLTGPS